MADMEPEIGTGKTVFVIAVVLGCFAVLYPKIFYHMMFEKNKVEKTADPLRSGPHEFGRPPMHHAHPALNNRNEQPGKLFYGEEGQQVRRTIDLPGQLKPGPVPGMRPTMGGPGMPQVPRGDKGGGGGTMGILMPLYTTGIVIFFVYTLMKIMMKKNDEATENGLDDRPSRRLHQQLRNQAITPEFMQHQQLISAAAKAAKAVHSVPNNNPLNVIPENAPTVLQAPKVMPLPPKVIETVNSTLLDTVKEELLELEELSIQEKQELEEFLKTEDAVKIGDKPEKEEEENKQCTAKEPEPQIKQTNKQCTNPEEIISTDDPRDDQIRLLKERLEETEKAMKMIVSHMATITTQMPKPISTTNTDNENNSESNKQEIIEEKSNSITNNTKDISDNKTDLSDQILKDATNNQMPNEISKDVSDDSNDDSETDEDLEVDETTVDENNVEVENLNATIRKRTISSLDAQES